MGERLEKTLIEFVEDYAKIATTAEEVEALSAVARVLVDLLAL